MTSSKVKFLLMTFFLLMGCNPSAGVEEPGSSSVRAAGVHVPSTATLVLLESPRPSALSVTPPPSAPATISQLVLIPPAAATPSLTAALVLAATQPATVAPLASTPGPTPTPTLWPTVTRQRLPAETAAALQPCPQRAVPDDLLILVTQQFSLPASYVPTDLVSLQDHFSDSVTVGIENQVRQIILEPLRQIIDAMYAAGLKPSILSGYRSYDVQYLAWKWWNSQYPERVAIMSARAGYSEHQLGTTVDFGSPEIDHLFHIDFANTQEGLWLRDNAHLYGFTMSYPANAYESTGFKYEPWHFRYVGVDMSIQLHESGQILTQWQLEHLPSPCVP